MNTQIAGSVGSDSVKKGLPVVFFGPKNTTFSHEAYDELAALYGAPNSQSACVIHAVDENKKILPTVIASGGYGAIAAETDAGGRVEEPIRSFADLLGTHDNSTLPFQVLGGFRKPLNFHLMSNRVKRENITGIVAHHRSVHACQKYIERLGVSNVVTTLDGKEISNGKAAELVCHDPRFATFAAFGPRCAATTFGLTPLNDDGKGCEDEPAATTFFLVGPKEHKVAIDEINRALIVFEVDQKSGSLVPALMPFYTRDINLLYIQSFPIKGRTCRFIIEAEIPRKQSVDFVRAIEEFKQVVNRHLCFGPFGVRGALP